MKGDSLGRQKSIEEASTKEESKKPFLSRFLSLWVTSLLHKSSERCLVFDDLCTLKQKHRSVNLLRDWKLGSEVNILNLLRWHFKLGIFLAVLTKLASQVLDYLNPVLLKLLIESIVSEAPIRRGLLISVIMLVVAELKSIMLAIHVYLTNRDATLAMSIIVNAVSRKSLNLSNKSRNEWPASRIVTLVTVDIEAMAAAAPFLHFAWSAVLELCIAMFFIYATIGTPAIGAIIILVFYIPFNLVFSKMISSLQAKQMKVKDKRVKFTKEVILGMKVVKLYAWEKPFEEKIEELRKEEVRLLARSTMLARVLQALNSAAPFLKSVVCFAWFVMSSEPNSLTPQIAFVSLIIFNMLRRPMAVVSPTIQFLTKGLISARRMNDFLNSEELEKSEEGQEATGIHLDNASFCWDAKKKGLTDISIDVEDGSFHAIVGPVGSGKSTLLHAILGELVQLAGTRSVKGSIAYTSQLPWILNQSIRSNVLYGLEYDKNRYDKVIRACDLKKDLKSLPLYDMTPVGHNGSGLSGGQRARIALARALYQDCDIYLLDDPFSAVDRKVANIMYEQIFAKDGLLENKVVILVTHKIFFTQNADKIHVMEDGRVIDNGTYDDLCNTNDFFSKMKRRKTENEEEEETEEVIKPDKTIKRVMFEPIGAQEEPSKEHVERGRIDFSVYLMYIRAFSYHWTFTFLFLLAMRYIFHALSGIWLSRWSDRNTIGGTDEFTNDYLQIYVLLGIGTVILNVVAFVSSTFGGIRASTRLHRPLVASLLRAPLKFFERTPSGRILNRLTGDMDVVDSQLPIHLRLVIDTFMNMLMVMTIISISVPIFVVFIVPFLIAYVVLMNKFLPASRQIRRLESSQKSALLSTLSQNIEGASTIRAFGRTRSTILDFHEDVDNFTRCRYLQPSIQKWLAIRLELLGNMMVFFCAAIVTIGHYYSIVTAGQVGLCVSYALTLTEVMNFSVRMMSLTENDVVAVERIKEYDDIPPEKSWDSDYPLIDSWPHTGDIEMRRFKLVYDEDLIALKDVSLTIRGGEKIGIVGRSGSGKSSLVNGLLRLVEPSGGDVKIDGVNTAEIGIHQLRSRITVIPQEPVLFSSSLRFNLDPFNGFTDSDLWISLEACQLKETVSNQKDGLLWQIEEGGNNMSLGERQLLCLCRALLKGGQIILLDEATAAVDHQTEQLVHSVVMEHFKQSTTLIIAHRLETIKQCDRVIVLDDGKVAEIDVPSNLLEKEDSIFKHMIAQYH